MKPIKVIARRPLPLALLLFAGLMLAAAGAQADARHYGKWKSAKVKLHELKAKNFRHYRYHKSRLSGLEDRISALEENGGTDISALEARITELEAEIVAMSAITDKVAALQTDVDNLAGVNDQLTKLAADVAALQSDLSSVSGDVSALTARVGDVESALAGLVSQTDFDALAQRVSDLESAGGSGGGGGGPTDFFIDCASGDLISDALAAGDPSRPINITVSSPASALCAESVSIHRDDVTIQGETSSEVINGQFVVVGSRRVVIENLDITNSLGVGVLVTRGSSVDLTNLGISGHAVAGIEVSKNSFAQVNSVVVDNPSPALAIKVLDTSELSVSNGNNPITGDIVVENNSNADLGTAGIFGQLNISGHSRARIGTGTINFGSVLLSRDSLFQSEGVGLNFTDITCSSGRSLVVDVNRSIPSAGINNCAVE